MNDVWTPARIAEMSRLADDGWSGSEIGRLLGLSKNAVLGKLWRLGKKRPTPTKTKKPELRPRGERLAPVMHAPRPKPVAHDDEPLAFPSAPSLIPLPPGEPITIEHLHNETCRWVLDVRDKRGCRKYCGKPVKTGKPWCPEHYKRVYEPSKKR